MDKGHGEVVDVSAGGAGTGDKVSFRCQRLVLGDAGRGLVIPWRFQGSQVVPYALQKSVDIWTVFWWGRSSAGADWEVDGCVRAPATTIPASTLLCVG